MKKVLLWILGGLAIVLVLGVLVCEAWDKWGGMTF